VYISFIGQVKRVVGSQSFEDDKLEQAVEPAKSQEWSNKRATMYRKCAVEIA